MLQEACGVEFCDHVDYDFERVLGDFEPDIERVGELAADVFAGGGEEVIIWSKENLDFKYYHLVMI